MTNPYPTALLLLPLQIQDRIPPQAHQFDLGSLLAVHAGVGLFLSNFFYHPNYALPLALFGLIAAHLVTATSSHYGGPSPLLHFLALWIVSIPLDVVWLLYRGEQARAIVVTLVGFNMVLKLLTAMAAARALQGQGVLPDAEAGGWAGSSQQRFGAGPSWLANTASSAAAPFQNLPGAWNGQQGPYRDQRPSGASQGRTAQSGTEGGYRSIYDEEEDQHDAENDAPQVKVENVADRVAAAAAAKGGR